MSTHTLAIVGAKFRPPAAGLLRVLPSASPLTLRREPGNQHDSNAIQVLVARDVLARVNVERLLDALSGFGTSLEDLATTPEWHLGYVPRTDAEGLAPCMDKIASAGAIGLVKELAGELTFSLTGAPSVRADFPD